MSQTESLSGGGIVVGGGGCKCSGPSWPLVCASSNNGGGVVGGGGDHLLAAAGNGALGGPVGCLMAVVGCWGAVGDAFARVNRNWAVCG
jgi:hypothetical protein